MNAIQHSLLGNPITLQEPPITFTRDFLTQSEADRLLTLSLQLKWQQNHLSIFGKPVPLPRQELMFADSAAFEYSYSGQVHLKATLWLPWLKDLRDRLSDFCGYAFHLAIGNLYRNGKDSIGWHADDEPSLGERPAIASISLGAPRNFDLRPNTAPTQRKRYPLTHGSLLLMEPGTQENWQHQLPKMATVQTPRVNWTFRPYREAP